MKLTLFYDGYCPLCVAEMRQLQALNARRQNPALEFADIHAPGFAARYPDIDPVAADRILHGRFEDGRMIYGLDVSHQAWRAVGKKPWLALLRWPLIRWFADIAYWIFARHRYRISWLLTGQQRCSPCTDSRQSGCSLQQPISAREK